MRPPWICIIDVFPRKDSLSIDITVAVFWFWKFPFFFACQDYFRWVYHPPPPLSKKMLRARTCVYICVYGWCIKYHCATCVSCDRDICVSVCDSNVNVLCVSVWLINVIVLHVHECLFDIHVHVLYVNVLLVSLMDKLNVYVFFICHYGKCMWLFDTF